MENQAISRVTVIQNHACSAGISGSLSGEDSGDGSGVGDGVGDSLGSGVGSDVISGVGSGVGLPNAEVDESVVAAPVPEVASSVESCPSSP